MNIKRAIGAVIIHSRWLMAPFYLGLIIGLVILLYKFFIEMVVLVGHLPTLSASDAIIGVLNLVDISLVGSLVLIVVFSGYENFVASIDAGDQTAWPEWLTRVGFSSVKQKLMASIVAISAIQVLEAFMNLDKAADAARLGWQVGIFATFVAAALVLAIADRLGGQAIIDEP